MEGIPEKDMEERRRVLEQKTQGNYPCLACLQSLLCCPLIFVWEELTKTVPNTFSHGGADSDRCPLALLYGSFRGVHNHFYLSITKHQHFPHNALK